MNKDIQILLIFFLFPCIGYTQEKETIPSISTEEEELIEATCAFPSGERKPMFVQYKNMSARERDSCFYGFFSKYIKQSSAEIGRASCRERV